jgi:stress-induced morphogen
MSKSRICQVNTILITPLFAPHSAHFLQLQAILTMAIGGCGQAYSAIIVSPLFEKKTTLARHRLVNTALKAEVAAIHAWTPKCFTPEQWEKQRQEGTQAVAPGKGTTGEVVSGIMA